MPKEPVYPPQGSSKAPPAGPPPGYQATAVPAPVDVKTADVANTLAAVSLSDTNQYAQPQPQQPTQQPAYTAYNPTPPPAAQAQQPPPGQQPAYAPYNPAYPPATQPQQPPPALQLYSVTPPPAAQPAGPPPGAPTEARDFPGQPGQPQYPPTENRDYPGQPQYPPAPQYGAYPPQQPQYPPQQPGYPP
ncbi:unnamed protein product [Sphagnum balticum]